MPTDCFLHLLPHILKDDQFLLYWIFTHYIGKTALGIYLSAIFKIITDTSGLL